MIRINNFFKKIISNNIFLAIFLGFVAFQGSWIALSTVYPSAYDEEFHIGVIEFYTHQYSPVITSQSEQYDHLRDLSNESSHFYHYLMSFPYRALALVIDNVTHIIIILRLVNVGFVIIGLYLYRKLFIDIGSKKHHVHVGLIVFAALPTFIQVSGIVNYDNMLFLVTPIFLIFVTKFIKQKNKKIETILWVLFFGMIASLIKYTFLPIFLPVLIYVLIKTPGIYTKEFWNKTRSQYIFSKSKLKFLFIMLFLTIFLLFSHVYARNMLRYHTPQPNCEESFILERCLKSDIVSRNIEVEKSKSERELSSILEFSQIWSSAMLVTGTFAVSDTVNNERELGDPAPAILNLYFIGVLISVAAILYSWNDKIMKKEWKFLVLLSGFLTITVFVTNYMILRQLHVGFAIQSRYLFTVLPIVIVVAVSLFSENMKNKYLSKIIITTFTAIILTQGGGVMTFMLRSSNDWYFQNSKVIKLNNASQKIVKKIIIFE